MVFYLIYLSLNFEKVVWMFCYISIVALDQKKRLKHQLSRQSGLNCVKPYITKLVTKMYSSLIPAALLCIQRFRVKPV